MKRLIDLFALLGVIPFVLGAVVAPLVGIAGEETAVPLGVIILLSSACAMLAYFFLVRSKQDSSKASA